MTDTSQDFTSYAGDAFQPTYTIYSDTANTTPLNLSTVLEITWTAQRDLSSAPVITKTKTGGGIVFVTDGSNGQVRINGLASDSQPLSGYYIIQLSIIDALSNTSTVATGRWRVGRAPIATYSGDPVNSTRDAVRMYIGDTDPATAKLQDSEIDYFVANYPSVLFAAAAAARNLAGRFARSASKRVGDLSIQLGEISKNYYDMADRLEAEAHKSGVTIYAGGTSIADMCAVNANSDRVKPSFTMKQFDIPDSSIQPSDPEDVF